MFNPGSLVLLVPLCVWRTCATHKAANAAFVTGEGGAQARNHGGGGFVGYDPTHNSTAVGGTNHHAGVIPNRMVCMLLAVHYGYIKGLW